MTSYVIELDLGFPKFYDTKYVSRQAEVKFIIQQILRRRSEWVQKSTIFIKVIHNLIFYLSKTIFDNDIHNNITTFKMSKYVVNFSCAAKKLSLDTIAQSRVFPASRERRVILAPGIDGSRFLPVLGNSIRNWWSRTLCNLTRGGPLIRFICGVTSENWMVHYFFLMLELNFKEFVILKK